MINKKRKSINSVHPEEEILPIYSIVMMKLFVVDIVRLLTSRPPSWRLLSTWFTLRNEKKKTTLYGSVRLEWTYNRVSFVEISTLSEVTTISKAKITKSKLVEFKISNSWSVHVHLLHIIENDYFVQQMCIIRAHFCVICLHFHYRFNQGTGKEFWRKCQIAE